MCALVCYIYMHMYFHVHTYVCICTCTWGGGGGGGGEDVYNLPGSICAVEWELWAFFLEILEELERVLNDSVTACLSQLCPAMLYVSVVDGAIHHPLCNICMEASHVMQYRNKLGAIS